MKWDALFSMQEKLDGYIVDNHQLREHDLFEEKFLALLVELGELANETRCFKFWSQKSASNKEVILEEYVDNIHFLLSIGLEKGYMFKEINPTMTNNGETKTFNLVFSSCLAFYKDKSEENYLHMFEQYLQLADVLGFTSESIIEAYHAKNAVNYERQESGY